MWHLGVPPVGVSVPISIVSEAAPPGVAFLPSQLASAYLVQVLPSASSCARRTAALEFGAERGLLQAGPSKENGRLALRNPELPDGFRGEVFKGKIGGEGGRARDCLLIGWWRGSRAGLQESVLGLKRLGGVLVPAEELRDVVVYEPPGDPGPRLHCRPSRVSTSPPLPR